MTSTEIQKWADSSMYKAEKIDENQDVVAYLLSAPVDPLGGIAACVKMYKGEVVRDLADVTDEERRNALEQIQRTILAMPLEAVNFHFMLEGVHRGVTHQMVRQRTAAYAQESTRFAVKEDAATAVALPPSLEGTLGLADLANKIKTERAELGLEGWWGSDEDLVQTEIDRLSPQQRQRLRWDEMMQTVADGYMWLVNDGMPAEEARGALPTNIRTRLHYITNLRNFYAEMGKRLSDQAQFEWRKVAMAYALALREFGRETLYPTRISRDEYHRRNQDESIRKVVHEGDTVLVWQSAEWQYVALTHEMKPSDFQHGRRTFAADFDRPSRIGERVDAFASKGIPSSEWTIGSVEHQIPPIHPDEWLLDPNSARLTSDMEFDIFGNRVQKGTGAHWNPSLGIVGPNGERWFFDGEKVIEVPQDTLDI